MAKFQIDMELIVTKWFIQLICGQMTLGAPLTAYAADPLPSWNDGPTKKAITDFAAIVTREGSPDFVPVAERIATFDNDGTLWAQQSFYFRLFFAIEGAKDDWNQVFPSGKN